MNETEDYTRWRTSSKLVIRELSLITNFELVNILYYIIHFNIIFYLTTSLTNIMFRIIGNFNRLQLSISSKLLAFHFISSQ